MATKHLFIPIKNKIEEPEDNEQKPKMKTNRKKDHPETWAVERVNSWHYRSRKLFKRYEKKIKKLSWNDTVLIQHNLTQKDNFGRCSK